MTTAKKAAPATMSRLSPAQLQALQQVPEHTVAWPEIAIAIFKVRGITKGWWRIGMQLRFAALTSRFGEPNHEHQSVPTALVGIDSIALFSTKQGGDLVFDAATGQSVPAIAAMPPAAVKKPARNATRSGKYIE